METTMQNIGHEELGTARNVYRYEFSSAYTTVWGTTNQTVRARPHLSLWTATTLSVTQERPLAFRKLEQ
jgi:hypothetical protein